MKLLSLAKAVVRCGLRAVPTAIPIAVSSSGAVLATIAACGVVENRNALAPINAIAHVLWGEDAFRPAASTCTAGNVARYTLPAVLFNTAAMGGWAVLQVMLAGRKPSLARALGVGALVSLVAYVVDYKLVGPRWTPGIEAHLPKRSLFVVYVALALGLALAPRQSE